ncbi:holin family protein [Tabrizicola sp. J26]|uniref:holin family protein n=1 Tax=Alitabrizicola rongguiensis TaxID=2909234 RepID=UPI001F2CE4B8|nr:holin family protein [Tabrizicola rongguiensis]MCF1710125.1 holin family protein [Tabrizicola rongguiensis]
MGLIGTILGNSGAVEAVGSTVKTVAEVFTPNATRQMEISAEAQEAALTQFSTEFQATGDGRFDRIVNGLNRLPRPLLAFGTLGLFVYAMVAPQSFGERMAGLAQVPEPLWWLLGAVVSFYFGAREAHYFRTRPAALAKAVKTAATVPPDAENAALEDWRRSQT